MQIPPSFWKASASFAPHQAFWDNGGYSSDRLPAKLDEAAISTAIVEAIAQTGASSAADMGKLMGVLKPQLAGQADMGQVSALVKRRLAG